MVAFAGASFLLTFANVLVNTPCLAASNAHSAARMVHPRRATVSDKITAIFIMVAPHEPTAASKI